jgi:hypothetical protein
LAGVRLSARRSLVFVLDKAAEAALELAPLEHDAPPASGTAQAYVGAQPGDLPLPRSARMRLGQVQPVTDVEIEDRAPVRHATDQ